MGRLDRGAVARRTGGRRLGLDAAGARVASGVYFYRLVTAGFTAARKLVVLE
jgi:hypothetical protein